jgi:O-antigen/teichoic acid export membrane protein
LAFHYISVVFVLLQGFLVTPITLSHVSPSLYGAWLGTGNVLSWLTLVDPGISTLMQQRIAFLYGRQDREAIGQAIATGILVNVGLAAVVLFGLFLASYVGHAFHLVPAEARELERSFRWGVIAASVMLASFAVMAANLGIQKSVGPGVLHLLASAFYMVAAIGLLLRGDGLMALPIAGIVRGATLLLGNLIILLAWSAHHLRGLVRVGREEARHLLGLSVWTFLGRLAGTLSDQVEALIVGLVISPAAASVIVLTGRALDPVRTAVSRVGPAFLPVLSSLAGQGKLDRVHFGLRQMLTASRAVCAVGVGGVVALNGIFVHVWVGSQFFGGEVLTVLQAIALAVACTGSLFGNVAISLGCIKRPVIAGLAESALKLILMLGLGTLLGLPGMPLASIVATIAVTGWYLPVVLSRALGASGGQHLLLAWLDTQLPPLVYAAAGIATYFVIKRLPIAWNWTSLLIATLVWGSLLSASLLIFSKRTRGLLRDVVRRRRSAGSSSASTSAAV